MSRRVEAVWYEPRATPHVFRESDGLALFGTYKARFSDGFTIAIPHTGYRGTVSEDPVDLAVETHAAWMRRRAQEMRRTGEGLTILPPPRRRV